MNLELNTAERIRQVWPILTPADIAQLEQEGTIESVVQATFIPAVLGNNYSGSCNLRRVYVCGAHEIENIVGAQSDWEQINGLDPNMLYQVAGLIVQSEPRIQMALVVQNGGTPPAILTPVIPPPPPPVEPDEDQLGPVIEPPVEPVEPEPPGDENQPD